jgi:ATP-binding cassette subfamily G (WHITE) protein 2 (PDR)
MYRVNPLTYIVEGFLGTSLANAPMRCSSEEIVKFRVPSGSTCGEYLVQYITTVGGSVLNPTATNNTECQYCPVTDTNSFLKGLNVDFGDRGRDFGLIWVFCVFNVVAAIALYWLARVPKNKKTK